MKTGKMFLLSFFSTNESTFYSTGTRFKKVDQKLIIQIYLDIN